MMTLKLVGSYGVRIYEAASFSITDESEPRNDQPFSRKVTAHDLVGGGRDYPDKCWWVGTPPYSVEEDRVFTAAYLMNSGGKTFEIISVPFGEKMSSRPADQTIARAA